MGAGGMVPMLSPDGQSGDIPMERVNDALSAGFKRAVVMTAPSGEMGYVPQERAADALKAGFKVGQPVVEKASDVAAAEDPGKAGAFSRGFESVLEGAQHMGDEFLPAMNRLLSGANEHNIAKAGGMVPFLKNQISAMNPVAPSRPGGTPGERIAETAGNVVGGMTLGEALPESATKTATEIAQRAVPETRGAMAARMMEVPPGGQFTRGELLEAARNHGVNLDLAQATDSRVAAAVKKANQFSLTGQGIYEANATKNLNALAEWADAEAGKYGPATGGREAAGSQIQQALRNSLEQKKANAQAAFEDLDRKIGSAPVNVADSVEAAAQKIVGENSAYYAKHPELKPSKAWAILEDLAERPKVKEVTPGAQGVMDAAGNPLQTGTVRQIPAPTRNMSWSELHQLRSDLMDFYRNNPDIVKGRSDAWIQQMVGTIDKAMTDSTKGMTPEQVGRFRFANAQWESIKSTFDNPQSPYYHAVRTQFASQVPGMLTRGTPELAAQVRQTLGSLQGQFQRQFVENLINGKDGVTLDLKGLNSRLSRIPQDHLVAMLGEDGARNLRLLGKVAAKVTADANPSGTAKVGVPTGELVNAFANPVAGTAELGAQYGAAKAINSPKVVDYFTRRPR